MPATTAELAAAFSGLLESCDPQPFIPHLAPGAVVWHNYDRKVVDALENMTAIVSLGQMVEGLETETRYFSSTDDGFVLQFVVHGIVRASGKPFEMHNCVVVSVEDARITRIEEYVDPTVGAQLAPA